MTDDNPPELLDLATVRDLNAVLGPHQLARLLNSFRSDLQTAPAELCRHLETGEVSLARTGAHRLKGAALCIGANAVATSAAAFERASRDELESLSRRLIEVASATETLLARTSLFNG